MNNVKILKIYYDKCQQQRRHDDAVFSQTGMIQFTLGSYIIAIGDIMVKQQYVAS